MLIKSETKMSQKHVSGTKKGNVYTDNVQFFNNLFKNVCMITHEVLNAKRNSASSEILMSIVFQKITFCKFN